MRELEAEVQRLEALLESAPDFITRITPDGNFLYLNRLAPGYRMADVIGTSVDNYTPAEFRPAAYAAMRAAYETRTVQQFRTVGPITTERVGHYLTRVSPVIENGEVTSLVMVATDVTTIEEQRILLQVALDAGGVGIWTHQPEDGGGSWDDTARRIFGFDDSRSSPTLEQMLHEVVHAEDRQHVLDSLTSASATGRYGPIQHRIVRANGEVRWVSATGQAIRNHEQRVIRIVGSVQDITERRALEARLLEAQKLESIGRLAGGVAHDFNNMLTAILGNVHFAYEVESLAELKPLLDEVRVTAERSAALTAQLLAFARRQVIEPKVLEPNALISRIENVFRRAAGERIRIELSLAARGRIKADESQLEQVVMNLITNGRDALVDGGVLTIETLDVELDQNYAARQADVTPGRYVMLAVSDTGKGIPADVLPHVFEPFFTTRSGGTGLGLATCYGIVRQSGGHIAVYSEPGQGTTFKVYLPRVDAEPAITSSRAETKQSGRGERVLLVEDEAPVRAVVERALLRQGYRVVCARTAEDALELVAKEEPFALLITDVVLPGLGGPGLAAKLRESVPTLRVLFISGYTENAIVHGGILDPGLHFLQKPFMPSDLLVAVRRMLDEASSS